MSQFLGMSRAYTAGVAVRQSRLVKFSADYTVVEAAAATDAIIGVSAPKTDNNSGDRVDVFKDGVIDVVLGGTVTRGDPITSNASGQGITAAPAAGVNNRIIGFAEISGVSGDIIPVTLSLAIFQG